MRHGLQMTGRTALGSVMDILYLAVLFHSQPASTNSHYQFNQTPLQSDLTRPVRFSVPVSESNISDQVVANLTALLWANTELPSRVSTLLHEAHFRPRYELLDVSANLMANLPPQRRVNFVQLVQLEPSTGAVRFTVPLDRERLCPDTIGTDQRCTISLLVAIHLTPINSSHFKPLTVYADLTVLVLDVNDNAPYFTSSNSADSAPLAVITVDEECPIGTMIQLPQATDPDTQEHGVQRYEFHPTSTAVRVREHFDVVQFRHQPGLRCEDVTSVQLEMIQSVAPADPRPVVPCLRTIRRLDRETAGDQFHFNLIATDTNGKRGEIAVQLLVRDVNDHAPEWATKLELFDSSSRSHWISASPSDPAHGTESRQTHYTFSVPECTTQHKLIRLEAQDKDDPQQDGGKITFRLSEHSPDRLSTTLRRRLFVSNDHLYLTDRGLRGLAQPNLTIVVVASDGAGRNTEAWFHLRIEDCNDHRPMILIQNTDYITIPEESTGQSHLVSLITVRDFDLVTSPNSQFSCFLNDTTYLELKEVVAGPTADDRDLLHSHSHQGDEITSTGGKEDLSSRRGRWSVYRLGSRSEISFDRETSALYTVMFECIDKGSPSLTASRPITIHIEDINDNAPQFISRCAPLPLSQNTKDLKPNRPCTPQFVFTVLEDAERGILIGSVRAVDLDSGENARVEYTLLSLHNNSTVPDSNESEVFRPETLFTVTPMGELHLLGELDRESQSYYEFLVVATDHGKRQRLSSTATVQITVADVNDCAPVFRGDYVFEVVESYGSSTIHQVLGTLNATDADLGRNGSVHYRLAVHPRESGLSGLSKSMSDSAVPGAQLVKVSHDGQITVYGVVDREQITMIMVDVIAEDNGVPLHMSTMTTVTIHVLDLNDNKPRFVQPEFTAGRLPSSFSNQKPERFNTLGLPPSFEALSSDATYKLNLSLDTSIGTLITKFEAFDPDYGPNGTLTFELIYSGGTMQTRSDPGNSSLFTFTLHPDGRLILTNHLEFDTVYTGSTRLVPRRYRRPDHLLIRVSDQGSTPEHVITGVQIIYHDASPILTETSRSRNGNNSPGGETWSLQPNGTTFGALKRPVVRRRSHQIDPHSQLSSKRAYIYAGPGKSHGLPVLYILALAICFALILVITSLVYLYFKMRKPSNEADQRSKHREHPGKQLSASVKLLTTENNGIVRHDRNDLSEDGSVTMHQNNTLLSMCDKGNNVTVAYRALSSPYMMLSGSRASPTLTGDSYTNEVAPATWATVSPGYMELTESVGHPPSFALLPSSKACTIQLPPNSPYCQQSGYRASSRLDNLASSTVSGSGYDHERFCRLIMHHSLPVYDHQAEQKLNPDPDESLRLKKSQLVQSDTLARAQATGNQMSTFNNAEPRYEQKDTLELEESTSESKCSELAGVQKSAGKSTASSLLLYLHDRQPSSAVDTRSHLTGGSFV